MAGKFDQITLDIINDKQLLQLFKELDITNQKRVINAGIRKAAKPIIDQAKSNFNATKKNKSTTGYSDLNSSFKIEPSKNPELIGVKIGVKYVDKTGRKNWYKFRWIEWGTKERFHAMRKNGVFGSQKINGAGKSTGKIEPTHFFYNAVDARKEQAVEDVQKCVMEEMDKLIEKYNKK